MMTMNNKKYHDKMFIDVDDLMILFYHHYWQ